MSCPYCGSSDVVLVCSKDTWPETVAYFTCDYSLYRCSACDLLYAHPLSDDVISDIRRYLQESYNTTRGADSVRQLDGIWGRSMAEAIVKRVIRSFRARVLGSTAAQLNRTTEVISLLHGERVRSVLDVGCSYGDFLAVALANGFNAYGVEPTGALAARVGRRSGGRLSAGFFPESSGPLEGYDAIVFLRTLSYMVMSRSVMKAMTDLVNPGGVIIIYDIDSSRIETAEMATSITSPLILNIVGEKFMRRVALDFCLQYKCCPGKADGQITIHILRKFP